MLIGLFVYLYFSLILCYFLQIIEIFITNKNTLWIIIKGASGEWPCYVEYSYIRQ